MSGVAGMRGLNIFIQDVRNAPNKEAEQARVDKELANIRNKFKNKSLSSYDKKKCVCPPCGGCFFFFFFEATCVRGACDLERSVDGMDLDDPPGHTDSTHTTIEPTLSPFPLHAVSLSAARNTPQAHNLSLRYGNAR